MKFFSILFLIIIEVSAQYPSIEWQYSYGGNHHDTPNSIIKTSDGGFLIGGESYSWYGGDISNNYGGADIWLLKLNSIGEIQWERNYGGSDGDEGGIVIEGSDGGFIVGGTSLSNDHDVPNNFGWTDFWIFKIDDFGNIEWSKTYGGTDRDFLEDLKITSDGGYILVGYTASNDIDVSSNNGDYDFWIVKLDNLGEIIWEKTYGGTDWDTADSVDLTSDGGYIVTGRAFSNDGDVTVNYGDFDYWVLKLDSEGEMEWEKSYGGSKYDWAHCVKTKDDGYIIIGESSSSDHDVSENKGGMDYWIVNLDFDGQIIWERSFGGTREDRGNSVFVTDDGGYLLNGGVKSKDGDVYGAHGDIESYEFWLLKLDAQGNIVWKRAIGGTGNEIGTDIIQTIDGGSLAVGSSSSSDWNVTENNGLADYWIVKLSAELSIEEQNFNLVKFYPNPVKNELNFSEELFNIEVYNLFGQKVLSQNSGININMNSLTIGTYILKAYTKGKTKVSYKFLKE